MSETVWVLTKANPYEGEELYAVFSTLEKAKAYVREHAHSDPEKGPAWVLTPMVIDWPGRVGFDAQWWEGSDG